MLLAARPPTSLFFDFILKKLNVGIKLEVKGDQWEVGLQLLFDSAHIKAACNSKVDVGSIPQPLDVPSSDQMSLNCSFIEPRDTCSTIIIKLIAKCFIPPALRVLFA